ncbi:MULTISPECIES: hypothetical protein [Rhodobacterales]|uniref:hypothetical protein n=1 Tax=Rhodobacterales TaxID=204455 RepID=UPI0011BEF3CB|nr:MULTISPECIES: hypothetical protein [Rhodobacterales]MDO6588939.1 hypothetical protein [Yoonia sp. 1_MG-2023]
MAMGAKREAVAGWGRMGNVGGLADGIDNLDARDAEIEIRKAVVTHGGTLIEPTMQWGPLEVQLSLIGVSASGATIAEAGRQWVKAVSRMTKAAA